jgi:CheY-like chemotaxis protein
MFTILLVEDNYETVEDEIEDVRRFLMDQKGLTLNLIRTTKKEEIESALSQNTVDVIGTDWNIRSGFSGIDVINLAKRGGYLTDILFYSILKIDYDEVMRSTDYHGFVEIYKGNKIARPLKRIVDKNLRRLDDIAYLRGIFISKVIDLELQINTLFGEFFKIPKRTVGTFNDLVLENRGNTLEGKIEVLTRIVKDGKLEGFKRMLEDLRELQKHRNYLAHCKPDPTQKGFLVSMGEQKRFDRAKVIDLVKMCKSASESLNGLNAALTTKKPKSKK